MNTGTTSGGVPRVQFPQRPQVPSSPITPATTDDEIHIRANAAGYAMGTNAQIVAHLFFLERRVAVLEAGLPPHLRGEVR